MKNRGEVNVMLQVEAKQKQPFADLVVDSEYFAALCGFKYPFTEYNHDGKVALLELEADTYPVNGNPNRVTGMMVWHNKVYKPIILIKEVKGVVNIKLINEYKLPYSVKNIAYAYIKGLKAYLSHFECFDTRKEAENIGRRTFLVNL